MIACLDAGWCGISHTGDFVESQLIIVSHIERQLLLGWKRENGLLQFHRHLVSVVYIVVGSKKCHSCGFRLHRDNFLPPLADGSAKPRWWQYDRSNCEENCRHDTGRRNDRFSQMSLARHPVHHRAIPPVGVCANRRLPDI